MVIKIKRGITSKDQAQKILNQVPQINAFYFFEDPNNYCGISARSLPVFSNKLLTINKKSLDFHFKRGDFENWIRSTIGDSFLANEIAKINESFEGEQLLAQFCEIINTRLMELKQLLAREEQYVERNDYLQ